MSTTTAVTSIGDKPEPPIKKAGIIYSEVRREYFPTEEQYITEKDALPDAQVIAKELEKMNIEALLYPGNENLFTALKKDKPDMVFNLVDSVKGNDYLSSTIPGMLDMIDMPYAGSGLLGFALGFNKFLTKDLLRSAGIPVPNFQLFTNSNDVLDTELRFPVFSKLNEIHGAVEINENAVSETPRQLKERIDFLIKTYDQDVLVEEYISGREITVMFLQGSNTKIYMAEKVFNKPDEKYVFATFADQWLAEADPNTWAYNYEKYDDPKLKELTRKALDITRMEDYGKFDVRLDASGRYYFIDSNVNPAFGPKELNTSMGWIIQGLYGVSFQEILKRLIVNTLSVC